MSQLIEGEVNRIIETMIENGWVVKTNIYGLFVIGPEIDDGVVEVVGHGRTFMEAFFMAERSKENKNGTEQRISK